MNQTSISQALADARATKNPLHLLRAAAMLFAQRRIKEAIYGIFCRITMPPAQVKHDSTVDVLLAQDQELKRRLFMVKTALNHEDLSAVFGKSHAVAYLPPDFAAARLEAVCQVRGLLVIGEYARPGKRIAVISSTSCLINDFYEKDPSVIHIHAILAIGRKGHLLVSTGDTAKYLDLWRIVGNEMRFLKRIVHSMAGHTTMGGCGTRTFCGTDFSHRPNYLEVIEECARTKIPFPQPAYSMHSVRTLTWNQHYLAILSHELDSFGGRFALSILDTRTRKFVFCDYVPYSAPSECDAVLHRDAVSGRSLSAKKVHDFDRDRQSAAPTFRAKLLRRRRERPSENRNHKSRHDDKIHQNVIS